jgi:hypothetical protein
MNGSTFLIYIERCLAPTLHRRDIVIIDNLPAHKMAGVTDAIEAVGARAVYLPPYSPDLNPIHPVPVRATSHDFTMLVFAGFAFRGPSEQQLTPAASELQHTRFLSCLVCFHGPLGLLRRRATFPASDRIFADGPGNSG